MICEFDSEHRVYVAAGRGILRPIVVEGHTKAEALRAFEAAVSSQAAEEYHFEQSMSHLADVAAGEPYGEDLG